MSTATTKTKNKRAPANTTDEIAQALIDAAAGLPEPPAHIELPREAMPFWVDIVCTRAKKDWSRFQLSLAAQLARTQYDIERRTREMELDGVVIENARGTPVANPVNTALEQLVRRQLALVRSLQLAGVGDPRVQAKRDKMAQGAQAGAAAAKDDDGDDLLA